MIDTVNKPDGQLPSHDFFRAKAEELRALAESETQPERRAQHLRLAQMYQALADQTSGKTMNKGGSTVPRIAIPKGIFFSR